MARRIRERASIIRPLAVLITAKLQGVKFHESFAIHSQALCQVPHHSAQGSYLSFAKILNTNKTG
jgi:hypothetical protein